MQENPPTNKTEGNPVIIEAKEAHKLARYLPQKQIALLQKGVAYAVIDQKPEGIYISIYNKSDKKLIYMQDDTGFSQEQINLLNALKGENDLFGVYPPGNKEPPIH